MRVIRDGVGTITQGNTTLHSNVRFLVDDKHRVAVFANGPSNPPTVYQEGEVLYTVLRKPCACKGDTAKMTLQRAWMNVDKVSA